jgi:hypothetical protein
VTGALTADLVVDYQTLAGAWQTPTGPVEMFAPDYVPSGHVFEDGTNTLVLVIEIGEMVFTDRLEATAVRIAIVVTDPTATPAS